MAEKLHQHCTNAKGTASVQLGLQPLPLHIPLLCHGSMDWGQANKACLMPAYCQSINCMRWTESRTSSGVISSVKAVNLAASVG